MSYEPFVIQDLTLPHAPLKPMARLPLGHVKPKLPVGAVPVFPVPEQRNLGKLHKHMVEFR